jgi:hypothetical protein
MKAATLIALLLLPALAFAQSPCQQPPTQSPLRLDMSKLNGMQPYCLDKGRFQDPEYNRSAEVDKIMAHPREAVPILIALLTDTRPVRPDPVVCYWYDTRVGDVAFMMLSDLFLDASWQHCTVPGGCWEILGPDETNLGSAAEFHRYVKRHGRAALQKYYRKLWDEYKDKVTWDSSQRCFRLAAPNR